MATGRTYDVDGALALLTGWVAAKIQTTIVLDLHAGSSDMDARGRALVACLAVAHRLCSAASVARYFRRTKSTLSEQMAACRARSADRVALQLRLFSDACSLVRIKVARQLPDVRQPSC